MKVSSMGRLRGRRLWCGASFSLTCEVNTSEVLLISPQVFVLSASPSLANCLIHFQDENTQFSVTLHFAL